MVEIKGFGDTLTVNNICIGNLSPEEHEKIEKLKGGNNYKPLENVVVSHVKDSSTLICRKPSKDEITPFIEEELLDGLCCYSAVNQGQLNEKITTLIIRSVHLEHKGWKIFWKQNCDNCKKPNKFPRYCAMVRCIHCNTEYILDDPKLIQTRN